MSAGKHLFCVLLFLLGVALLPLGGAEAVWPPFHSEIILGLRLPRLLFAALVGGCLSMLGATYQILFHNPLSEPYVLGVSSGATLAVVASEVFLGIHAISLAGAACGMLGGIAVALVILAFSAYRSHERPEHLVLFGVGMNFVLASLLFLLLSFQLQSSSTNYRFLFGQIPWVSPRESMMAWAAMFPIPVILWLFGRRLDALSFGDETARSWGVSPVTTRNVLVLTTSLLISGLVIFTGSIGFVGLAIPHVVRLGLKPQSSRGLLFGCFFLGGAFLMGADVVSRVLLPPFEFPIGTITTLLGGPLFLYLLWKR